MNADGLIDTGLPVTTTPGTNLPGWQQSPGVGGIHR
jgi:hypothetical protein